MPNPAGVEALTLNYLACAQPLSCATSNFHLINVDHFFRSSAPTCPSSRGSGRISTSTTSTGSTRSGRFEPSPSSSTRRPFEIAAFLNFCRKNSSPQNFRKSKKIAEDVSSVSIILAKRLEPVNYWIVQCLRPRGSKV